MPGLRHSHKTDVDIMISVNEENSKGENKRITHFSFTPGDSLTITDGMTSSVTDMCRDTSDNTWISTGSIAVVRFISSAEGHGYAFSYQSFPRNESVSGKYHDNSYKRPCSNKRPLPLFRK